MNRRRLLKFAGLAPVAPAFRASAQARRIVVTELEVMRVRVNARGNWILTRLHTSAGTTGIGDASHGGSDDQKIKLIRRYFELLKGRSIFDIEWLRRAVEPDVLQKGSVAAIALSGLEQCLWDLQGKAFSAPAYQLFGGMLHPKIRNYANINRSTEARDPAGFARMAAAAIKAGFTAVKLAPYDDMPRDLSNAKQVEEFTALGIERAKAVRDAIGPQHDLLIDVHSRLDMKRGIELAKRMEPLKLFWLEEVTPAKPLENLAAINRAASMPTAGGESIYGMKGFLPYVSGGAVDILMPDVKYCGGMLELKKIASLAEAAGMPVSPHGPASPVGNLAAAHVCAGMPNFQILEFSFGEVPWRSDLIEPPEVLEKGGMLALSDRPGLGVTLNEKVLARHRID